jgi:DNA invertase Pin-like site-specific DNA recombinase
MLVGYARVSTDDQKLDLQKDAFKAANCEKVFEDQKSGATVERPGLQEALNYIREGDTLVVWRLDRLGRSMKDLVEMINFLESKKVGFMSLQESIDTSSCSGKLLFHLFGALAEFERNLIRERTNAGLLAARARGRKGGRPKSLNKEQQTIAFELYESRKYSIEQICETLHISRPTLYKYLKQCGRGPRVPAAEHGIEKKSVERNAAEKKSPGIHPTSIRAVKEELSRILAGRVSAEIKIGDIIPLTGLTRRTIDRVCNYLEENGDFSFERLHRGMKVTDLKP